MAKLTEKLSDEHIDILKVADALVEKSNYLKSGGEIDFEFFENAIDFIKNYADKYHHAKEEGALFEKFCENSKELHCNPIRQMLYEHDLGRNFIKGMIEGLKNKDKKKIVENAEGYSKLIQEHIYKEDNVLYPLAEKSLSNESQEMILNEFRERDREFEEKNKKYIIFLKNLNNK